MSNGLSGVFRAATVSPGRRETAGIGFGCPVAMLRMLGLFAPRHFGAVNHAVRVALLIAIAALGAMWFATGPAGADCVVTDGPDGSVIYDCSSSESPQQPPATTPPTAAPVVEPAPPAPSPPPSPAPVPTPTTRRPVVVPRPAAPAVATSRPSEPPAPVTSQPSEPRFDPGAQDDVSASTGSASSAEQTTPKPKAAPRKKTGNVSQALPLTHKTTRGGVPLITMLVLAGLAAIFLLQALFPFKAEWTEE